MSLYVFVRANENLEACCLQLEIVAKTWTLVQPCCFALPQHDRHFLWFSLHNKHFMWSHSCWHTIWIAWSTFSTASAHCEPFLELNMPIPFGFSAGDFVAGIKLCKNAFEALSDARGARADYAALRETLDVLEKAFNAANQVSARHTRPVVVKQISNCKECIQRFLKDFAKFELLKNVSADQDKVKFAFRKLQWSLCKEGDVRKFREHLQIHVDALQLQLSILQMWVATRSTGDWKHVWLTELPWANLPDPRSCTND